MADDTRPFASAFQASDVPERVRRRFWSRVEVGDEHECWPTKLSLGGHGYGQIGWQDPEDDRGMVLTHRLAWALTIGPIPEGMTVDHECRHRPCCNPSHLRLLSNLDNAKDNGNARKTHCKHGHEFTADNTVVDKNGHRRCIACARSYKDLANRAKDAARWGLGTAC